MPCSVTKKELDETQLLLRTIESWEKALHLTEDHGNGRVTLIGTGFNLEVTLDGYVVRNKIISNCVEEANKEVQLLARARISSMVEEIIEIWKKHCPLTVEG